MSDTLNTPVTVETMYGDWDYDAAVEILERSLNPRPGTSMIDTVAATGIGAGDTLLDIGGREGQHALLMAERFGCRAVSVDPIQANLDRGLENVADHEFGHLVELRLGSIEDIPAEDDSFDLVFSRDVLGHVADLATGLRECARVLRPGGVMVIHEVFATPLLEPMEQELICAYTASVPERFSVATFESEVDAAGLIIGDVDVVGSEWYEANQEKGTVPNYLLQVSRLRRARAQLIEELGEVPYQVMYGNALWSIYQLIGKLESRVYTLREA